MADIKKEEATFKKELQGIQLKMVCPTDLELIKESEILKTCKILDKKGIPRICGGQNLTSPNARDKIEAVGGNYDEVMAGGCLTEP